MKIKCSIPKMQQGVRMADKLNKCFPVEFIASEYELACSDNGFLEAQKLSAVMALKFLKENDESVSLQNLDALKEGEDDTDIYESRMETVYELTTSMGEFIKKMLTDTSWKTTVYPSEQTVESFSHEWMEDKEIWERYVKAMQKEKGPIKAFYPDFKDFVEGLPEMAEDTAYLGYITIYENHRIIPFMERMKEHRKNNPSTEEKKLICLIKRIDRMLGLQSGYVPFMETFIVLQKHGAFGKKGKPADTLLYTCLNYEHHEIEEACGDYFLRPDKVFLMALMDSAMDRLEELAPDVYRKKAV